MLIHVPSLTCDSQIPPSSLPLHTTHFLATEHRQPQFLAIQSSNQISGAAQGISWWNLILNIHAKEWKTWHKLDLSSLSDSFKAVHTCFLELTLIHFSSPFTLFKLFANDFLASSDLFSVVTDTADNKTFFPLASDISFCQWGLLLNHPSFCTTDAGFRFWTCWSHNTKVLNVNATRSGRW